MAIEKETGKALFELHVDAFVEGIVDAIPDPESLGLTREEGREITLAARRADWAGHGRPHRMIAWTWRGVPRSLTW